MSLTYAHVIDHPDFYRGIGLKGVMIGGGLLELDEFSREGYESAKILHDSGGFQVFSGRAKVFDRVVYMARLLHKYSKFGVDIGFTLDVPVTMEEDSQRVKEAMEKSVEFARWMEEHRERSYKLYHCLHGFGEVRQRWYDLDRKIAGEADGYGLDFVKSKNIVVRDYSRNPKLKKIVLETLRFVKKLDKPAHLFAVSSEWEICALGLLAKEFEYEITTDSSMAISAAKFGEYLYFVEGWELKGLSIGRFGERVERYPCSCEFCRKLEESGQFPPFEVLGGETRKLIVSHNMKEIDRFVDFLNGATEQEILREVPYSSEIKI